MVLQLNRIVLQIGKFQPLFHFKKYSLSSMFYVLQLYSVPVLLACNLQLNSISMVVVVVVVGLLFRNLVLLKHVMVFFSAVNKIYGCDSGIQVYKSQNYTGL
jgi:hypothetical protein